MKTGNRFFVFLVLFLVLLTDTAVAQKHYQVGVCDWMVLKRQKLGEFKLAKELGCDGIEMDMGGLGKRDTFDNKMRVPAQAMKFCQVKDSLGIQIGAVAMSGFYGQSFAEKATYCELVEDCLNTMEAMGGVKVAFLPLGGCGNDWTKGKVRKTVVKRLHEVGEMAHAQGKIIGIDTPLDAAGNLKLLKEIKSEGIKIFYKLQTAVENGVDICADMKALGGNNICAIHASNTDGHWIQNDPALDMPAIRKTLDEMDWRGWLFVERSRDTTDVRNVKKNYGANVRYLKEVFAMPRTLKVALDTEGRDSAYVQTIVGRARKCTDALGITGTEKGDNVLNIIANRYFKLNDIYSDKKSPETDSRLYRSHFGFEADLRMWLSEEEISTVKDVMTYNVRNVKFKAQCEMIPNLTDEEKEQIMAWLIEAREYAIDCESSNKKHEMFNKYMGRVNNYLSKRGYDMKKERDDWYKRVNARGGKL